MAVHPCIKLPIMEDQFLLMFLYKQVYTVSVFGGLVIEEYMIIILGEFSLVLHEKMYVMGTEMFVYSAQNHVVGTHQKCLGEALLMRTHIMFLWRNKKSYARIIIKYCSDLVFIFTDAREKYWKSCDF